MIRIQVKNGNLDAALDKFNAAKKEENRAFDEQVSKFFAPKGAQEQQQQQQQQTQPQKPMVKYESILARSRRA